MMSTESYGNFSYNHVNSEAEAVAEEVRINGWSKVVKVFDQSFVSKVGNLLEDIYQQQEKLFGRDVLEDIDEVDQVRCLTRFDSIFLGILRHKRLKSITEELLGTAHILMLQNAVISKGGIRHHQSSWHRDIPYQNFISSEPLAINMLLVLDQFDEKTGATELLPYSHKLSQLPSDKFIEKHKIAINAQAGDVLVFDSMIYHRAGLNRSKNTRKGLNSQLCKPFIRPQYQHDIVVPSEFILDEYDRQLLGQTFPIAMDESEFRERRIFRKQKNEK
ncbi:hypothetical protein KUL42_17890 [Alteromonas sp. KUL42]|uniref:phytanoyl-CoA dioxygenase family protein n=1 Tax=Alteromonas sp. KUL42 TaxID=2480797 RepID=UPI0010366079|nr:phytanoyl-CoA dioxygenase family protein [Alteromonas sp. KUL42]TAP35555.1 hypothetical protein EYR97_08825 [Alteromonas sp. KUL42]GEA07028.1 hypothetical protein KUL42_17890 [Alteromonas sp. KUL42]